MSGHLTRMFCKIVLLAVLVLIAASLSASTFASTNSGIDTPTGVSSLPFAVEGVEGMILWNPNPPSGPVYVGIGTTAPQAPLDVNGGMRGGGSGIVAGDACSPEGMLGYDSTSATHQPVYCSQSGTWTAVNSMSAFMNRTWHDGSTSGTNNFGYPIELAGYCPLYTNRECVIAVNGGTLEICIDSTASPTTCAYDITKFQSGATWSVSDNYTSPAVFELY